MLNNFLIFSTLFFLLIGGGVFVWKAKIWQKERFLFLKQIQKIFSSTKKYKKVQKRLQCPEPASNEFLKNLMHEIRPPLLIAQNLKGMVRWGHLHPEDKKCLTESEESIQELNQKLDQILEAHQWQEKAIPLEKSFLSLKTFFDFIKREFPQNEESIILEITPLALEKKFINIDTKVLKLAFQEIICNSFFFSQKKKPHVWIHISEKKGYIYFVFRDDGIGIDEEHWNSVFDLLFVVSESRNTSECGLGIGLTKAKGIIEAHGGRIEITNSEKNKGTTIEVRIPFKKGGRLE